MRVRWGNILFAGKFSAMRGVHIYAMVFIFEETLCLTFKFIDIFGYTSDFNFVLANEAENDINDDDDDDDDDDTFAESEIVNREIVNSVNNKNHDICDEDSLNIAFDSFQTDACNNIEITKLVVIIMTLREYEWLQKQYKR